MMSRGEELEPADALTIATSAARLAQTKRIERDRQGRLVKRGFAKEKLYSFETAPVRSIEDLAATLERLRRRPYACVVRGKPVPGLKGPARRLAHADPEAHATTTLLPAAPRVLAVDLDGLDQGPVDDPAVAPEEGVEHALWRLRAHSEKI
jgi:hypothetical protein